MLRKMLYFVAFGVLAVSVFMTARHFYMARAMQAGSAQARTIMEEFFLSATPVLVGEYGEYDVIEKNGVDFDAIRAVFGNDDIVAHILIEGTSIDYLVVQASDNFYYLSHDIWGNQMASGWIFLDYEADISGQDQNWVIYGHNMRQDHKFHSLRRYRDYNFLRAHQVITLTTPYGVTYWEIFSFYSVFVGFPYNHANYPHDEWPRMLDEFVRMSMHDTGVQVTAHDRIITLSTCTNRAENERYVLHGRLIM